MINCRRYLNLTKEVYPLMAVIILFMTTAVHTQPIQGQSAHLVNRYDLITDRNRNYEPDDPNGAMHGGFGPHLRSIMNDPFGRLWFAFDEGPSVNKNELVRYYMWDGNTWKEAGKSIFEATDRVQQNTAHILIDSYIYSYGIDIENNKLVECQFNTLNFVDRGCKDIEISGQPYTLPGTSNYIGAAVSPSGYRLAWWTSVGKPGKFYHIWNFGEGWNGPVETEIAVSGEQYDWIGYLRAVFQDDLHIEMIGQSGLFQPDDKLFVSASISIEINNNYPSARISFLDQQYSSRFSGDIWINKNGDSHAIANLADDIAYYYKPAGQLTWNLVQRLEGIVRARFLFDETTQYLHLITADKSDIVIRSVALDSISHSILWSDLETQTILKPESGFSNPSGIYNQSRSYQTTTVDGIHFGVVGEYPGHDHKIYHFKIDDDWPSKTETFNSGIHVQGDSE